MKLSSTGKFKSEFLRSIRPTMASLAAVIAISVIVSAGCGGSRSSEGNLFRIPWPGNDGSYRLKNVSITTYDQPDMLQGRFVKILVDPFVSDGQLSGSNPVGRFIHNKDGVSIPADYASLQATAIHAHFERFNQMDESLGAKQKSIARIGIQANVVDKDGAVRDNAIYDGQLDALLIVPYSQDSLPISINGGILAHEHFHMIFQDLVMNRIGTSGKTEGKLAVISRKSEWADMTRKKDKGSGSESVDKTSEKAEPALVYNLFFLRAVNEGLADFWAWVYTGDAKFIGHSLPAQTEFRRMDVKVEQLTSQEEIFSRITNDVGQFIDDDAMVGRAYMIGTSYSRVFREMATELASSSTPSFDERMAMARTLIAALPAFADVVVTAQAKKMPISPNAILQAVYSKLDAQGLQKASTGDAKVCSVIARVAAPELNSFANTITCAQEKSAAAAPPVGLAVPGSAP